MEGGETENPSKCPLQGVKERRPIMDTKQVNRNNNAGADVERRRELTTMLRDPGEERGPGGYGPAAGCRPQDRAAGV